MSSFNRVVLMGHLTRDPELRYTAGKKAVCNCGIAVNDRYKKDDEWTETVDFVELTFWGRNAEVVNEYLRKGSPLLVEGKLRQETWEDKKTGTNRSTIKVSVDQFKMLGGKPAENNENSEELVGASADDAPF